MSIPFPTDPLLAERATALLETEALAARLSEVAAEEVTCRPRYARYKPRTSLLVQYDIVVGSSRGLGHAWLFADSRAARTWRSASFARLLDRAQRRHPTLPIGAMFLADLKALVEVSPLDSRLPALVRAASSRKVARLLGDAAAAGLQEAAVTTIRHKPGRKAVLRFDGERERLYLKVHSDGRSAGRFALARAVAERGVPTAMPRAHLQGLGAVVYDEADGDRLADFVGTERYRSWLRPAAEALRAFHGRAPVQAQPPSEAVRIEAAGRAIDSLVPSLRGAGARLASAVATRIAAYDRVPVLIHGDFYDDQLLVSTDEVAILDLDEARPGHPLFDVGNYLAHLSVRPDESNRAAFLDACADAGLDLDGILAFEAAGVLALAARPFRRLEMGWPERMEELVELAAARLRADRSQLCRPDQKLPQLHVLADPAAAGVPLGRALGRPVRVSAADVVRHKPGRRCTLRYRLDDGASVFAKTYASRRAARVHESYRRLAVAASVRLPAPLGWDADSRLVATAPLPGDPVRDRLLTGESTLGDEIAVLLHAFHTSGAVLERRRTLRDEILPLVERVDRLSLAAPTLAPAARRCLSLARAGCDRSWRWRWRPIHHDFYEDQLVEGADGLGMLDLDDAAMSEPAVDVANLIAHLRLRALRSEARPAGATAVARAFLRKYRDLDPELEGRLVTFLVGATLLRLAEIHLPRAGRSIALALLVRAERALCLPLAVETGQKTGNVVLRVSETAPRDHTFG